jgi:hypothetical protein
LIGAVLLLSGAVCVAPLAAQRAHFGGHVTYNFDVEEFGIGAQAHLPVSRSIEFYPSFDYYFVDPGSLIGFSADLKFRTPGAPLYLGGGLNVLRAGGGGTSNSDTGFDLFGGFETRYGASHPYVEVRGLFHDNTSLQVAFGINLTLF